MDELLKPFETITLEEMKSVKLMNRTDTKFVTNTSKLYQLLKMAQQDYYVQVIDGERNLDYDTTYFDTTAFDMYNMHQSGHLNRQKIRFRTYCINHLQFMEVKTKNNHGRTKKKRIEVSDMDLNDEEKRQFLHKHLRYDVEKLQPVLSNHFSRVTLVNKGMTERLTIDTGLNFHNLLNGNGKDMGQLVVIELKRDGLVHSPVLQMLRKLRIQPHGFSKYCMGSALTGQDHLPVNRFKCKLIEINKLVNQ
ncbi:MAG: polyphosphate polymerase domain-containing protein [Prevotella sp.]|nr:polyphosphate polymerase domain-containing protein [Prevotella sp.]